MLRLSKLIDRIMGTLLRFAVLCTLGVSAGIIVIITSLSFHGCSSAHIDHESKARATVMITRMDKRSGGTGVILNSGEAGSRILTNSHVCEVTRKGGLVITESGREYSVSSFKQSIAHDLCLIFVTADLKENTDVADEPPTLFSAAVVSGHPKLHPTIITEGHFSHKVIIEVMTGIRPCLAEDLKNNFFACILAGGIPILKSYEAQQISALIQPGSSGSAVYNDRGEIAGLVFAGEGDLGYGMIVPHEYIVNFLEREIRSLEVQVPNTVSDAI